MALQEGPVTGTRLSDLEAAPVTTPTSKSTAAQPAPNLGDVASDHAPTPVTLGSFSGCQVITIDDTQAYLCTPSKPSWLPSADAIPGVVTAVLGFILIHVLSVRRQRRDEQFKMVISTRDLLKDVTDEAILAWANRSGRSAKGQELVHSVSRVSRALNFLKLRESRFNLSDEMVAFRKAVTNDFEAGSVATSHRLEIESASQQLDDAIYRQYLKYYG